MSLLLSVLLAAAPALTQARAEYEALDYEKCVATLDDAPLEGWSRDELRDRTVVLGLCEFSLGHQRAASLHFVDAVRIDPDAALPELVSPSALELFERARRSVLSQEALADQDLKDDAPREVKLEPRPPRPPLSWAERHQLSRRAVPIALGGLAVAALAATIGLGAHAKALEAQANGASYESDFVALGRGARDNAVAANVALGLFVAAGAGAAIAWFTAE